MDTLWVSMWGLMFWELTTKSTAKNKGDAKDPEFLVQWTTSSRPTTLPRRLAERPYHPLPPPNWSALQEV